MFARIARRYDRGNRILSGGVDLWWRKCLVRQVAQFTPARVLDLATGSGDVAFALSQIMSPRTLIVGMDFCQPMLDEAELKKTSAGGAAAKIEFRKGDGLALPLGDSSFDAVTISFGLRNMADRQRSLSEMRRVLRPNGRLYVLEFSQPWRWLRPLYYFYIRRILPNIAGWVTGDRDAYVYLNKTIAEFPSAPALAKEIAGAGFKDVRVRRLTFGVVALHEAQA